MHGSQHDSTRRNTKWNRGINWEWEARTKPPQEIQSSRREVGRKIGDGWTSRDRAWRTLRRARNSGGGRDGTSRTEGSGYPWGDGISAPANEQAKLSFLSPTDPKGSVIRRNESYIPMLD